MVNRKGLRRGGATSMTLVLLFAWLAQPAAASSPAAPPGCSGNARTFAADETPISIPDSNATGVTSQVRVTGAGSYLRDLDVVTSISHTFNGDLNATLTSPGGTEVTLTSGNGGAGDNAFAGTIWDDDAGDTNPPGAVTDTTFADKVAETRLVPEEAMGAFVGENPNGVWTLRVTDTLLGDLGSLNWWEVRVVTLPARPRTVKRTFTQTPGTPLTDNSTTNEAINVFNVGYILDVNVRTDIVHPASGELAIVLNTPAGTPTSLTTHNGGGGDNLFANTLWDDDAGTVNPPGAVTDTVFASGQAEPALVPEEALGAVIGESSMAGTWNLQVVDTAPGNTGTFNAWALQLTTGYCGPPNCTIIGTNGHDNLAGTPGNDRICTFGGSDTVDGKGGADTIFGGPGNDRLVGGSGGDVLFGETGRDELLGQAGDDRLNGGPGNDSCTGGPGDDKLVSC